MIKVPSPEELIQIFQKDAFACFTGCEIIEAEEGRARVRMVIRPQHLNGVGLLHGGAVFTAADLACAVAANSHGRVAVTLSCAVTYMSPATGKSIVATASEIAHSARIGTYSIDVVDEASGKLITSLQATAYITDKRVI